MNKELFVLKNFMNPYIKFGDKHRNGIDVIIGNLSSGIVPDINTLITLINNYVTSETEAMELDLSFIDSIAISGAKVSYPDRMSKASLNFVKEMEDYSKNYVNVCLCNPGKDMWDISEIINDGLNYIIYRVMKAGLSQNEEMILLVGLTVLQNNYNYWAEIFTGSTSEWQTWWLSVGFDIHNIRKSACDENWILNTANGAMTGCSSALSNDISGWGAVIASLFAKLVCAIYPDQL